MNAVTEAVGYIVGFVLVGLLIALIYPHPKRDDDDDDAGFA